MNRTRFSPPENTAVSNQKAASGSVRQSRASAPEASAAKRGAIGRRHAQPSPRKARNAKMLWAFHLSRRPSAETERHPPRKKRAAKIAFLQRLFKKRLPNGNEKTARESFAAQPCKRCPSAGGQRQCAPCRRKHALMGQTAACENAGHSPLEQGDAREETAEIVVALAGNPNVGKSTLFNLLTGLKQHTGNWPGKTVGSAWGRCVSDGQRFLLADTPGAYSLITHSAEEAAARDAICFGGADVVAVVCDATCLERGLNLALQVIEAAPRAVLCLNLMDEARKQGVKIDLSALSRLLGVRVVACTARSGEGARELLAAAKAAAREPATARPTRYAPDLEDACGEVAAALGEIRGPSPRFVALRLLEADADMTARLEAELGLRVASLPLPEALRERLVPICEANAHFARSDANRVSQEDDSDMRNTCPSADAQENLASVIKQPNMRDGNACVPLPVGPSAPQDVPALDGPGRVSQEDDSDMRNTFPSASAQESLSSAIKQPNMRDATPCVPLPDDRSAAQDVPAMDGPGRVSRKGGPIAQNPCLHASAQENLLNTADQPNMRDSDACVPLPDDRPTAQDVPAMDAPGRTSQEGSFDMRNTCPAVDAQKCAADMPACGRDASTASASSSLPSPARVREETVAAIYRRAEEIVAACVRRKEDARIRQARLDRLLTSRLTGLPVMLLLLALVLYITIAGANAPSALLSSLFVRLETALANALRAMGVTPWLISALCEGMLRVLGWVIAVMLPPMAIFFPLFTLLEDLGYLPRVAFNLDRQFKRCHACGKQALTMCMGLGCNAAGVVGCRIIDSPRERMIAILTNAFMPCNGRFSMMIALIGLFLAPSGPLAALLLTGVIVLGVLVTFAVSRLLSGTLLKGMPSAFTLELPPFRRPQIGRVIVRSVLDRTLYVLGRAAVIAAPAGLFIWVLANAQVHGEALLAHCVRFLDPFAGILGLDGAILMAFVLAFPANEIVLPLAMMAYLCGGALAQPESTQALGALLRLNGWTWLTALNTILFSLMHWPCSTTVLTIARETRSAKWTLTAVLLPTACGMAACALTTFLARTLGLV